MAHARGSMLAPIPKHCVAFWRGRHQAPSSMSPRMPPCATHRAMRWRGTQSQPLAHSGTAAATAPLPCARPPQPPKPPGKLCTRTVQARGNPARYGGGRSKARNCGQGGGAGHCSNTCLAPAQASQQVSVIARAGRRQLSWLHALSYVRCFAGHCCVLLHAHVLISPGCVLHAPALCFIGHGRVLPRAHACARCCVGQGFLLCCTLLHVPGFAARVAVLQPPYLHGPHARWAHRHAPRGNTAWWLACSYRLLHSRWPQPLLLGHMFRCLFRHVPQRLARAICQRPHIGYMLPHKLGTQAPHGAKRKRGAWP